MPDQPPGEDAGHTPGIHGPDCTCNPDITVPRWLSLHITNAISDDDLDHEAASYAAVTGDAVISGILPSLVLYTAHTLIAMRGRGWVPEDADSRLMADPTTLAERRPQVRAAFRTIQRIFELANESLWAETGGQEGSEQAHDEALKILHEYPVDDVWWVSVLTCDMGILAVHELDEIDRFLWTNIADRPFIPDARPRLYNPHVVIALARIGGALVRKEDERVRHWWSFYGDMHLQPRILEAMLLEMGDSAIPGEIPTLMALDHLGVPQAVLDPYTTDDPDNLPKGSIPLEDLKVMRLVAQTIISIGNGDPFDMEELHEKAGDLIVAVAMSVVRSFGYHVTEAWYRANHRHGNGPPDA